MKLLHVAFLVSGEARGGGGPVPFASFLVRAFDAQLQGPQGPRRRRRALRRRHRHNFQLPHRGRLLPVRRAQAIRTCVAASDDHHVFAGGQNRLGAVHRVAGHAAILLRQEIHGEVDAAQGTAFDFQLARLLRADGQHRRVEGLQVRGANARTGDELHALGSHLRDAAVDPALLHFEVRDAVAQ